MYSYPLQNWRVVLLLLRQRRDSLEACCHTSTCCAADASQLLKPASKHREATAAGIGLGTTSRRRKPTVETCVDNNAKLRPQASVLVTYMQRTTSGAAGNGLYTTIKYMRGAAGIGLGATAKYLRRTTSAAANNGMSTTIIPLCSVAFFEVNS